MTRPKSLSLCILCTLAIAFLLQVNNSVLGGRHTATTRSGLLPQSDCPYLGPILALVLAHIMRAQGRVVVVIIRSIDVENITFVHALEHNKQHEVVGIN